MKWSRDGEEGPDDAIVLRFPSGIQARLEAREQAKREPPRRAPAVAETDAEGDSPGLTPASTRALVAWHMVGVSLFAGGRCPSLREATEQARAVVLAMEMERQGGNITHVADALRTSRRVVRQYLQRVGLYERKRGEGDEDGEETEGEEREDNEEVQGDGE